MAVMNIESFLRALEQSNLLPPELLDRVVRRVREGNPNVDPRSVAKWLIDKKYLSLWQANNLLAGRTAFFLGRYKLLDRIGQGGMGVVFKAQHAVMDRIVALKVMSQALLDKPHAVARFNREVKTAAALNHPNIIAAFDADCVGNTHFLVMEYADGNDLNQWLIGRGPLPVSAACEFAMQAAEGLGHAHRQGMVHRDIKPVNMLLVWSAESDKPVVKILDMGLARFVSETQEDGGLTRMGQTIGTPDYIAPEAAENFKNADIRADIFSLGCALFKLLTGRLPFGGTNTMEKLLARATKPAPLVRQLRPEVPAEVEAVVAKMLATDPAQRYQTPAEVAAALAPFAASTLNDSAALEMFREKLVVDAVTAEALHADADTSLEEFFRDFAMAPIREESSPAASAPAPRRNDDADLELMPLDDDPPPKKPLVKDPSKEAPKQTAAGPAPVREAVKESKRPAATSSAAGASPKSSRPRPGETAAKPRKEPSARSMGLDGGPLDKLSGAALLGEAPAGSAGDPADGRAKRMRLGGSRKKNAWDSPLMLVGGGALLLLILAGAALLWANYRRGSEARLALANDSYRSGAYAQALREYDTFLKDFPKDEQASFARVRRGLIQVRQAAESKSDWPHAYETADNVLREISGEEKFRDAQEEFASLLPTIAEGLAEHASRQQSSESVRLAQATLELVNRYVPRNLRPGQRLQNITAALDVTTRQLARHDSLNETIAVMEQAAQSGETAAAYQARASLLKTYPDLAPDERLQAATLGVSGAERLRVQSIADLPRAEQGEPPSPVLAAVTPAATSAAKAVSAESPVVFGLFGGSVFGIDSASGRLLWRRYQGFESDWLPLDVSTASDSDVILADTRRREVFRVARRTGEIAWRTPLNDDPVAAGCRLDTQAVVSGASGRICWFDLDTGAATKCLQLPQGVRVAPVADRRQRRLYQLSDHSNLYVLSASGDACEEVFYLGHPSGSIAAPPATAGRYLFVVENNRLDHSLLRVLLTDDQGLGLKLVQELPLEGHVQAAPIAEDRSLYVVTDLGALYLFEIGTPDQPTPLKQLIALPATGSEHLPHHFVVRGDKLWVGAEQLTAYNVQAARGRFTPAWVKQQKEFCTAPLQLSGNAIFYAGAQAGFDGVSLSALDTATGARSWQTRLASPSAGGPLVEPASAPAAPQGAWTVTAAGAAYAVDGANQEGRFVAAQPLAEIQLAADLDERQTPAVAASRVFAFAAHGDPAQLLVARLHAQPAKWDRLELDDQPAAAPIAFAGGLLVAGREGQVTLLDASTGRPRLAPFQPPLRGGEVFHWRPPVALDDEQFVISDGHSKLYRVEIRDRPQPHLAAAAEAETSSPIVSSLALLDDRIFAVTSEGKLVSFRLPTLEPADPSTIEGNVVLGPARVGQQALLATDRDRLLCIDGDGSRRWEVELLYGPLAGPPVELDGAIYCAAVGGTVWRLDPQSGSETARVELGETLDSALVAYGSRFLIAARDGTVLAFDPPRP